MRSARRIKMCTAITYYTCDHYFGRNLDLEHSYCETVTITPRNFPLKFRFGQTASSHYAFIGMAYVQGGCPLYYDAVNEKGLCAAALNFPGSAHYTAYTPGRNSIAPFEFIPWILADCCDVEQAKEKLQNIHVVREDFSRRLHATPLHWMVSDRRRSIAVEPGVNGLKVYDDPVGVLTNNPPFEQQLFGLNNYMSVSPRPPVNDFCRELALDRYSRGMGGLGLPGDWSSASRFVRAAFTKLNSRTGLSEEESVSQVFHILDAVSLPRGCVLTDKGEIHYTVYSACCSMDRGVYYYTTYENRRITAVDMHKTDLDANELVTYPLVCGEQILRAN